MSHLTYYELLFYSLFLPGCSVKDNLYFDVEINAALAPANKKLKSLKLFSKLKYVMGIAAAFCLTALDFHVACT